MSLTGFLKFGETFLPITRGELVKDSNGDIAFHSPLFEAKATDDPACPGGRHGLITGAEKKILQALASADSPILNLAPLSLQFGENEAYIYNGTEDPEIKVVAGDNITIEDNKSGEITLAANDPTVKMETITTTSEEENYPILLANLPSNQESESEYRITTYKHSDLNYNPFTKTLIVPYIEGISKFAKSIYTGNKGIGTATNPIYVNKDDEVVASNVTVGNSDTTADDPLENYAIPVYLKEGVITAIDATIGGPIELGQYGGFGLSYMSSGTILSYHGSLGYKGKYPLCVENGVLQQASEDIGLPYYGIYMLDGALTQMDYYLKANIHPGTGVSELVSESCPLAVYSSAYDIGKLSVNVGVSNHPLWVENGALTPIKISAGEDTLYIVGTVTGTNNGKLCTGTQGTTGVRLIGGNKVYAYGGFFESSDETLKDFHSNIPIDLDRLSKLPKKYFTWKADEIKTMHIGTSAQELQKLYPELVKEDEHGLLNVAYDKLSIVALAAIDQLHQQINELKSENQQMQTRLEKLEKLIYANECQS